MRSRRTPHAHWHRGDIARIAAKCKTYREFRTLHPRAYSAVRRNGWQELVAHLPRDNVPRGWWTLQRITSEAKKYETRTTFYKGTNVLFFPSLILWSTLNIREAPYIAAYRRGWLDRVCTHMQPDRKPPGYWTRKRVLTEAKKYSGRAEFFKQARGRMARPSAVAISARHARI